MSTEAHRAHDEVFIYPQMQKHTSIGQVYILSTCQQHDESDTVMKGTDVNVHHIYNCAQKMGVLGCQVELPCVSENG